ncbi:3-hydroxyacyl-CoA dehydrogenase [Wilcoxina mikolae CBS 423.85]|nr:3-hydroxyacyl-CoA dehydrogenase [Wilcoxina mikolae CBS 423.85]
MLQNITIIGAGTIGLSFCALHLSTSPTTIITIHDPRPDLLQHIQTLLPTYLPSTSPPVPTLLTSGRLILAPTLSSACTSSTHLVQEQGPETHSFKSTLWPQIEALVSPSCHLWTSTSGIPASAQSQHMKAPERLLVVHPFNPPHIMLLVEIVPGPSTPQELVEVAREYFQRIGHRPVVIRKEKKGFVANRLAFVLFREACSLVQEGVVRVEDVDAIVENSVGLRWGVKGPFASYHDGGGAGGLGAFLGNVGKTVKEVWADGEGDIEGPWDETVVAQTEEAYGEVTKESLVERDRITRRVLEAIRSEKEAIAREKKERAPVM